MMKTDVTIARSQRGAALLIMMLILILLCVAVLMKGLRNGNERIARKVAVSEALAAAKDALIAYAVTYGDNYPPSGAGPGHLVCPDTSMPALDPNSLPLAPYGLPNAPCGPNAFGRLPHWVTLPSGNPFPFSDYGSASDQQFWYAVTDAFLATPNAGVVNTLNTTTPGGLSIDGQTDVVAVLIAPGAPLAGQSRPSQNAANYLEGGNTGGHAFVTAYPAAPDAFNDIVVPIRRSELISPVTARVAEEIKKRLDAYHVANGSYPPDQASFAGALAAAPQWLAANNWPSSSVTTYARVSNDTATLVFNGCGITYTLTFGTAGIGRSQPHC